MIRVGGPSLRLYNHAEPKRRSTLLSVQAEHCRERTDLPEQTRQDMEGRVDRPMAQVLDACPGSGAP